MFLPKAATAAKLPSELRHLRWDPDVRSEFEKTLMRVLGHPDAWEAAMPLVAPPSAAAFLELGDRRDKMRRLAKCNGRFDGYVTLHEAVLEICGLPTTWNYHVACLASFRGIDHRLDANRKRCYPSSKLPEIRALAALVAGLPEDLTDALRTRFPVRE